MDLQRRFKATRDFLIEHNNLLQSEVLNHYPKALEAPYESWISELIQKEDKELISIECELNYKNLSEELQNYFRRIKELTQIDDIEFEEISMPTNIERGMSAKKRHEATRIKSFLSNKDYKSFMDIGSGKGHLSSALIYDNSKSSHCIDIDPKLQSAGELKLKSHSPQILERLKFEQCNFNSKTNIDRQADLVLGLHSCGDLSVDVLRYHINNDMDALSFGCCYHKLSQYNLSQLAKESPLELSFHALNLATRSNRKLDLIEFKRRNKVKVYRYVLHMILHDELNEDFQTLGNAHYKDYDLPFKDYAIKHAPQTSTLNLESLFAFYLKHETLNQYLVAETIRSPLGRVLELYLILDRVLWLQDHGQAVEFKQFFRSELSPRNIGIFSKKVSK
ncbi:MAG: methyltransferase [Bacteriovoracaceae bacterium]|nr:methyltransferase [Bacteriovoracaceae bacterium]